jgi:hypothetical protein
VQIGHFVLRSPVNHGHLNAIEQLLADVKNNFKWKELGDLAGEALWWNRPSEIGHLCTSNCRYWGLTLDHRHGAGWDCQTTSCDQLCWIIKWIKYYQLKMEKYLSYLEQLPVMIIGKATHRLKWPVIILAVESFAVNTIASTPWCDHGHYFPMLKSHKEIFFLIVVLCEGDFIPAFLEN